ncbi:MAG: hypothetical protein EOP00_29545 [Pedobacter sp.]|nr:MAG: hypothetical protein EOP00_29545 [Pedobacter sp.]
MKKFFSLILFACFLMNSCKTKEETLTADEARKFALSLEKDAAEKRIDFIEKNIFVDALLERMFKVGNMNIKKSSRSGLQKGVEQALKKHNSEKNIYNTLGTTGSLSLVKQYEKDGRHRVIFRAYGTGGLNYFDMELTKMKGKTGIADILVYTTGDNLSTSMAELAEKLLGAEGNETKDFKDGIADIQMHVRYNDYKKAKAAYDKLPAETKNTKVMEALYLLIIPQLEGDEYHAEMSKLESKYASDPNSQLMLIDVYLVKKDYEKALRSIDMIDKNINTDPFLNFYRGLVYNMKEDREKAIEHFEKAAIAMPGFGDNLAELFVQYASAGNKEQAIKYFKAYKGLKNKDPEIVSYYEEQFPFLAE